LTFAVTILTFAACFSLLYGLYSFRRRDKLGEFMNHRSRDRELKIPASRIGKRLAGYMDLDKIDGTVKLAGNPWGWDGPTYLGTLLVITMACLVLAIGLWTTGKFGPLVMILLPFVGFGIPRYIIHDKAAQNREILRVALMDFTARMEHAVLGGALPLRVVQWAAEGDTLLAEQMKAVNRMTDTGIPLYRACSEYFADRLGIAEAEEIAAVLRLQEQRGGRIADQIRELNREFRQARKDRLEIRTAKLKTSVEGILTLVVLFSLMILIIGPVVLQTIRALAG
jgi:Flp pilus assembly protein TadB